MTETKRGGTGMLLPCPFCGGKMVMSARSAFHPGTDCWLTEAGEASSTYEIDETEYALWNRRAALSSTGDERREAIEECDAELTALLTEFHELVNAEGPLRKIRIRRLREAIRSLLHADGGTKT